MENEYPVANHNLVLIAKSNGLVKAAMVQESAVTAAEIDQPELANVLDVDNGVSP